MQTRFPRLAIAAIAGALCAIQPVSHAATFEAKAVITDEADISETGLNVYPGAMRVIKKDRENGNGDNVKVDFSIGQYSLKVIVGKWRTESTPSEVAAFYKRDMTRFGEVVTCPSPVTITLNESDDASLCASRKMKRHKKDNNISVTSSQQFRVGIKNHQRVVDIKEINGATEIQLIYVNAKLPDWMMKSSNTSANFSFDP